MATPTTLPSTFVAGNVLTAAQMNNLRGAFRVLQTVSTTKTDTFSTSSTTYTDITGVSATITPSATSSKVLIFVQLAATALDTNSVSFRINGGNAATGYIGTAAGSRSQTVMTYQGLNTAYALWGWPFLYLDSPATTSATTYTVQTKLSGAGQTMYVNRSAIDTDSATYGRGASTITVMEISA